MHSFLFIRTKKITKENIWKLFLSSEYTELISVIKNAAAMFMGISLFYTLSFKNFSKQLKDQSF